MNEKITALIKYAIACLALIVVAIAGYYAGGIVKYFLDIRKAEKVTENFQRLLEEPYRKDTYGGKTPEDTWAMFLEALKKEDIELASKYFVVNKQDEEREKLFQIKQDKKLELLSRIYSQELKKESTQYTSDEESYYYIVRDDFGGMADSIKFYRNPYTEVWKITNM